MENPMDATGWTLRSRMLIGDAAALALSRSHVAVFGLGGVGSWCAEALSRIGVGELTLVDQDLIKFTNINRQLIAHSGSVGESKAAAMAERVLQINPSCNVHAHDKRYDAQTRDFFFATRYDYIVDAIDLVACKLDLIRSAQELSIPIISALGAGNKLDAQRLCICDIGETRYCPFARVMRKELRRMGITRLDVVFSDEAAQKPSQCEEPPPGRRSVPGSIVWVTASAGMLLAQHVALGLINKTL